MRTEATYAVTNEYDARRLYLATANINISELFEKALQLIQFITDNRISKEDANEQR